MKKEKNSSPYEKQLVVKSQQSINITEYRECDLNSILEKIKNEFKKREKNLSEKNSSVMNMSTSYFAFSANVNIKRLETDAEYNKRIAQYEKSEETKRKKEEEKIKREFKKLQELQKKYYNFSSPEEVLQAKRMEKANDILNVSK